MQYKIIIGAFMVLITISGFSQGTYLPNVTIPVDIMGSSIPNGWSGGLNTPIFSQIDLNGDGKKDLFIFDKDGDRITTYINNGTFNTVDYHYAPEYRSKFPADMHDWVLLYDYNCDGKEDIFTYSYSAGMTVYRNDYSVQTGLKFNLVHSLVYSMYGPISSNLYVSSINLPALVDVDFDGDLDVLTFPVSGNFVEYHKNMAQENFNRCDTLVYQLDSQLCWGNFGLSGFGNSAILGITCRVTDPGSPSYDPGVIENAVHSGSCMIGWDSDGDHDIDLINGDVLGNNLLYIENGGDSSLANMVSQDSIFPSYDTPVNLITFPAPYYMDVNNDGNKDLIVAPCISGGSAENFNNVWYYKNTTNNNSNVFNFQKNRFLSEEMIEVGTGANPVFHDVDSDGLIDIIVGNFGYFNPAGNFESSLAYYHNVGSATLPAYNQVTIDFGGFMSLPNTGLNPAFGDIDSDGDADLFLGETDGKLLWYENTAGPGNMPVYVLVQVEVLNSVGSPIDVGQFSAPQLVDMDRDGLLDLVIGEKSGNLNYYENTGTPAIPEFTYVTNNFGGINVTKPPFAIYGYSQPYFYDSVGVWNLYVGSLSGYIYNYDDIDNNLSGNFNLIDSMAYNIYEPSRSVISGANIDGDSRIEFVVGNVAGGITIYDYSTSTGIDDNLLSESYFNIYPIPASSDLIIKFTSVLKNRDIVLIDAMGKFVHRVNSYNNIEVIDISKLSDGIYFCRVVEGDSVYTKKFIVRH
jgi:dUTPase